MQKESINTYIFAFGVLLLGVIVLFFSWEKYSPFISFKKLYEAGEYARIVELYDNPQGAEEMHNVGNAAYNAFLYEDSSNVGYLETALKLYSGALHIEENTLTRNNYELTRELLEKIKNESMQDQWGNQSLGGQKNTSGSGTTSGSGSNSQNTGSSEREEKYYLESNENISGLSEDEKKELENYIESLKKQQKTYQKYYGKTPQDSFDEAIKNFFGSINRGGEKDW